MRMCIHEAQKKQSFAYQRNIDENGNDRLSAEGIGKKVDK